MFKLPLTIKRKNNYATVYEADGNNVPFLTDVELGWTDTSTGNYHDPEAEFAQLQFVVDAINATQPTTEPPEVIVEIFQGCVSDVRANIPAIAKATVTIMDWDCVNEAGSLDEKKEYLVEKARILTKNKKEVDEKKFPISLCWE